MLSWNLSIYVQKCHHQLSINFNISQNTFLLTKIINRWYWKKCMSYEAVCNGTNNFLPGRTCILSELKRCLFVQSASIVVILQILMEFLWLTVTCKMFPFANELFWNEWLHVLYGKRNTRQLRFCFVKSKSYLDIQRTSVRS